ncbi:MAG TPA: hypothetical protein VII23_14265 [Terriglobales bacterium]
MSGLQTGSPPGGEGGGGEIQGPEHQPGGVEVTIAGGHDAEDFRAVQGEVARGHGHAKPRDAGEAASTGHVVAAGSSVKVVAAAGASSNGGTLTVAAVGKSMAAGTDDQVLRTHRDLRRVI